MWRNQKKNKNMHKIHIIQKYIITLKKLYFYFRTPCLLMSFALKALPNRFTGSGNPSSAAPEPASIPEWVRLVVPYLPCMGPASRYAPRYGPQFIIHRIWPGRLKCDIQVCNFLLSPSIYRGQERLFWSAREGRSGVDVDKNNRRLFLFFFLHFWLIDYCPKDTVHNRGMNLLFTDWWRLKWIREV